MNHFMIVCPVCKVTWQQCRCPDMNKSKTEEICPSCRQKVHEMEKDRRESKDA